MKHSTGNKFKVYDLLKTIFFVNTLVNLYYIILQLVGKLNLLTAIGVEKGNLAFYKGISLPWLLVVKMSVVYVCVCV